MKLAWTLQTGQVEGHEAPPIVNNGVMFVATPGNQVLAIDAKDGDLLWRYKRPIPDDMLLLHPTSRGVGLFGDKVYFAAADAVLVALDAKTGKEVWKTKVEDYTHGYYMTLSPLVADGKVMVGCSGGELGVRGFVAAFDAETGKPLWRTYTVPAPGEPGSETWPKGDQWKTGGGSVWIMGNYDPATNIAYWGTGNGGPWMGDQRPGDNLYTSSVLALDVATGAIKGYHQYHPERFLGLGRGFAADPGRLQARRQNREGPRRRRSRRLSVGTRPHTRRHDRFRRGRTVCETERVQEPRSKDRTAERRPGAPTRDRQKGRFLPVLVGRQGLAAGRLQPQNTAALYPGKRKPVRHLDRRKGRLIHQANVSSVRQRRSISRRMPITSANCRRGISIPGRRSGAILSPIPNSGGRYWQPAAGSSLWAAPTIGISAPSMPRPARVLWQFRTGSGVIGVPVSFQLGGKQYIAVQSGWGVDSARMQARLNLQRPYQFPDVPQGGAVWLFALE